VEDDARPKGAADVKAIPQQDLVTQAVQSHLFFGPMARGAIGGLSLWVIVVVLSYAFVTLVMTSGSIASRLFDATLMPGMVIASLRLSKIQTKPLVLQARIGWWITKVVGGLAALFGGLLIGMIESLHRAADASFWWILGLLWVPGIEFIPSLVPRQRCITFARILGTGVCIFYKCHRRFSS